MSNYEMAVWAGFTLFILAMLALDLGVFQRRPHAIGMKEALVWFAVWTGLAIVFNVGVAIFHERGLAAGLEFFTGYLVEKSLSIDNVFVFVLIFTYFHVPPAYQHKVLFWGIVGAILLRMLFIVGGLALLERFHWTLYVFGAFLVVTGLGMMRKKESQYDPEKNWLIRTFRRFLPVTDRYEGSRFFARQNGRLHATPLFIVLLAIESSDIVFAVDSIPAIFAITSDPFIVYTSNIFAMLGLRALYFAVAGFMRAFHFLHYGFASIILILGMKMLLSDVYKVPVALSLVLIIVILLVCVIVSLLRPRRADLKLLFGRTERLGLIPFRRLLLIENVLDLGDLTVRHALRPVADVRVIRLDWPWEENLKVMRDARFSRYPLVKHEGGEPFGVIHVKKLFLSGATAPITSEHLRRLARPCLELAEALPLEEALARFQGPHEHMAIVRTAAGDWTGILTIEDVLEELVGKIGDEFDVERGDHLLSLADALSPRRIDFELRAASMRDAVRQIIARIPREDLSVGPDALIQTALQREQARTTYAGKGLAIVRVRLDGIEKPVLAFARSDEGVPLDRTNERATLVFLLLTPSSMARAQSRVLADLADLIESEYVMERLRSAEAPEEVIEAIRAGQQVALD